MFCLRGCRKKKVEDAPRNSSPDPTSVTKEKEHDEPFSEEPLQPTDINMDFNSWLNKNLYEGQMEKYEPIEKSLGEWTEIRLFLSSTFIDTHAERDKIVKEVIPEINRKMAPNFIRIIPVDLRWGVLAEESKSCFDIQKTCLNQIDNCRMSEGQCPWFLGLRTSRYGWLQNEVMPSQGFEQPEYYDWIDKLGDANKAVSITSLEVCHATRAPDTLPPFPTVFFYRRKFTQSAQERLRNDEFKWVFDFEYTEEEIKDPELRYQYTRIDKADRYAQDMKELDQFLSNKPHVMFTDYSAGFNGEAYYTNKRENAKSFGVGYVSDLDEFAYDVEQDLLTAIKMNFIVPDVSKLKLETYLFDTIQHENAIKLKASTFVGRREMVEETYNHLQSDGENHTLILHGDPGCGKSGLLAAVAHRAIGEKGEDDFVFVHAVDSCPGSNLLEHFLRRLHVNLRTFRRDRGEVKISKDPPESITDLKQEHQSFLTETGQNYPHSNFLIIIDAVNQFHDSLGAWDMWWLIRDEGVSNVRFLISTLTEENNTYQNALTSCRFSTSLLVTPMSKEDLMDMVSTTLERYNKKLTCYDDGLLGNQMELLLSKSSSPLFLIAACEALRKFGIFEKVSEYIASFPTEITSLFSFLLEEWSEEYGKEFTEDVCGLLALSKDGLLENQINDLLRFKEVREKGERGGFLYDSSFSRLYGSISSFLAAGGGGYLRFFHDQLKYTIRDKFLDETFSLNTHSWMCEFFMMVIRPKLRDGSRDVKTSDYFEHVLNQIVHHQLQVAAITLSYDSFKSTLRNIYFVRERILCGQHNALNNEYVEAIESATSDEDKTAFKLWAKFVQLYTPAIQEFPQFTTNMALNQAPISVVRTDTLQHPRPTPDSCYPLTWTNIPSADDPMAVKIPSKGVDCVASSVAGDVVIIAAESYAGIYDQSSGETLHKLPVSAYSILLGDDEKLVFIGDLQGIVYCYDVLSGALKYNTDDSAALPGCVTWLGTDKSGNILAGSGHSRKTICWGDYSETDGCAIFNPSDLSLIKAWSCEEPAFHHTYNSASHTLISSHKGSLSVWDSESGEKLYSREDGSGCIYCLDSHMTEKKILSGNNDLQVVEWRVGESEEDGLVELRRVELACLSGWAYGGVWSVRYGVGGDYFYCTEPQSQSVQVFDQESKKVGELKGHSDCINCIAVIPGARGEILSTDRGQKSVIWKLPSSGDIDACKQDLDEKVQWVGFTVTETHFVTVTDSHCRLWEVGEEGEMEGLKCKVVQSVKIPGFYRSRGVFHPNGEHLLVTTKMDVLVFDMQLELLSTHTVLKTDDGSTTDIKITPDGTKFLITECRNSGMEDSKAFVWSCEDPVSASEHLIKDGYGGRMFACGVSHDNRWGIVGGHRGTMVLNLETGETKVTVSDRGSFVVSFLPDSLQFLVSDGNALYRYSEDGTEVLAQYFGHGESIETATFLGEHVVTGSKDGTVRIFHKTSGRCQYAFFNHRSQSMTCVAAAQNGNPLILASNSNGMLYILKY